MDTTKVRGVDIAVYVGNVPVGCDETCDLELTSSMVTTTSKCSKDPVTGVIWDEVIPNINSVKVTGSGLIPMLATAGYDEVSIQQLALMQINQTLIYFTWGIAGTNLFFGMNGYITTTKGTGDYKDVAKYNYTIQGTGKINTFPVS
jgi:hypothetical protein